MTPDSAGLGAADRDLAMLAASASATGERLQSAANAALLAVLASDLFGLLAIPGAARGTPIKPPSMVPHKPGVIISSRLYLLSEKN